MWASLVALKNWYLGQPHMDEPVRCSKRCGHNSFTNGENVYVWGGHCMSANGTTMPAPNEVWVFNCEMEAWSVKICTGEIPKGTSGACCGIVFPYLYVLCGHCQDVGHSNRMRRLNLIDFVWEAVTVNPPLISPRDKAASWVYQDKIYCFGGYGPDPEFNGLYHRGQGDFAFGEGHNNVIGWNNQLLEYDPAKNEWSIVKCQNARTIPLPRAAHAAVLMEDKVYLFGGRHNLFRLNDLHCLDMKTLTWGGRIKVAKGPVPEGRSWHTLSRLNHDQLFLFGGFSQIEDVFDDAWIYTLSERRWTKVVHESRLFRGWHSAVVTNNQDVYVFGGFTHNILANYFCDLDITDSLVRFRFKPLSLKQLCLEKAYRDCSPAEWEQLPKPLRDWLFTKRRLQAKWLSIPLSQRSEMEPIVVDGLRDWTDDYGA